MWRKDLTQTSIEIGTDLTGHIAGIAADFSGRSIEGDQHECITESRSANHRALYQRLNQELTRLD
jgi:hypothetical protein